jgi:hypothetical protein
MDHREVVGGDSLPAHKQAAIPVVPTVRALDDPAPRLAADAADHGRLSTTPNVRDDAPRPNGRFGVNVVVALVETEVSRPPWTARGLEHDSIERRANQPLVVNVGSRDQHGQRHSSSIGENVAFHAEFPAIRRVRTRVDPPLGALAMALSRDAKSHLIPRRLS